MINDQPFETDADRRAYFEKLRATVRQAKRPPLPIISARKRARMTRHIYAEPIGPNFQRDILHVATRAEEPDIERTAARIIDEVCAKHGVSLLDVKSARRTKRLVHPRQEIFYRLRHETLLSFPMMGRLMGHRDHSTAVYGVQAHEKRLAAREASL